MTQTLSTPLNQSERLHVLDLIRGIAVLGILMMNIQAFSMPFVTYMNPTVYGDLTGINYWSWYFSHLIFDQKFMSIFSMLFGMGVLIFAERADAREGHSGKRHYIRMMWLLVFGLIHAYLIWWGDILVAYAISGSLAYLFRDAKVKTWLWTALGLIVLISLVQWSQGFAFPHMTEEQIAKDILPMWQPDQPLLDAELKAYLGSWTEAFNYRVGQTATLQLYMIFYVPKILALNLIGMAMLKSGFVKGAWSKSQYLLMGLVLITTGMMLTAIGAGNNMAAGFHYTYSMAFGIQYNYWGSAFTAVGYISLLMLLANNIQTSVIKRSFARVGQMAFTNYIAQSLLCTFIIYGHGFGLYGQLERYQQVLFTIAVWLVLIVFSNVWMSRFRFGPLEWLWRSLTYGKLQSIQQKQKQTQNEA